MFLKNTTVGYFKYLVLFSASYYPVLVLAKNWHFFQPYLFEFCEFYSGIALYDVYDEVGDFPFKGHICAWMCEVKT